MSARQTEFGASGLYHFSQLSGNFPVRLHLRVDPDGSGLLLANAAHAAHLSPVGVTMVHAALEGLDDAEVVQEVQRAFAGGAVARVTSDLEGVRKLLADLLTPTDDYPVTNYGAPPDNHAPRRLMAPFQAYVTQGDPDTVAHLLRSLWDSGVPQATFLAQPERPPEELVRLVECAEDLGMITGLRAVAGRLPEGVLRDTGMAGLDFLKLVLLSADPAEHDGVLGAWDHAAFVEAVAACRDMELCPVAQIPLTDGSADELPELIDFALQHGIGTLEFFALACLERASGEDLAGALPAQALPHVATQIAECADDLGVRFLWAPPVRFEPRRSLGDQVVAGPRAGGDVSLRIEADGTVFAPRGPREPCGNLLRQPWDAIWRHPAFTRDREGAAAPARCPGCPGLEVCNAGCIKDPAGWSDDTNPGGAQ
jgi:radical SAM protein with 4Fe4S-binding SPASM domain